jgi:large subunit ribosomal protein L3
MKRFNFHGKDATHGTSKYFRHGGSNGSNTFPGRVLKNKGMPGHMGDIRVTVSNLEVVDVRPEENLVLVKGNIPGAKNSYVLLRTSKRAKGKPTGRSLVAVS